MKPKDIFCIEGIWDHDDITDKSSILPLLQLMREREICDYVYHDCATSEELTFLLTAWCDKKVNIRYPILYLAFHGSKGCISLNNDTTVTLEELALILEGKCTNRIIYIGSCSTIDLHGNTIRTFLKKTNALAIIGYNNDVDWLQSSACDLLTLDILQKCFFTDKGLNKIQGLLKNNYQDLQRSLGLKMVCK